MADLIGNEKLQRFIQLLADLNHRTAEILRGGETYRLIAMNDTIEEMYSIQNGAMLQSNEQDMPDAATSVAVHKFLRNIFDANVRIIRAYGLA